MNTSDRIMILLIALGFGEFLDKLFLFENAASSERSYYVFFGLDI